jgi:hypothetical protein
MEANKRKIFEAAGSIAIVVIVKCLQSKRRMTQFPPFVCFYLSIGNTVDVFTAAKTIAARFDGKFSIVGWSFKNAKQQYFFELRLCELCFLRRESLRLLPASV